MRLLAAAGLAGACLATSPLLAADLFGSAPPPLEGTPPAQTELGSNWYIRGDVGYGVVNESTITPNASIFPPVYQGGYTDPTTQNWVNTMLFNSAPAGAPNGSTAFTRGDFQTAWTPDFSLGGGYRVNDWFRVEAIYQIFKGPGLSTKSQAQCAGAMSPGYNYTYSAGGAIQTTTPEGYVYNAATCNGYLTATQFNNLGMANAYIDLGHWWLFDPFIGAGAGLNASTINGSLNWYNATTGVAYTGPTNTQTAGVPQTIVQQVGTDVQGRPVYGALTDVKGNTPQGLFEQQSWNRTFSSTKFTIAAQAMAGFGVPISQSATLDFTYHIMSLDLSQGLKDSFQSVSVGVRYNID